MSGRGTIHKHEVARRSLERIADYLATEASLRVALRFLDRAEEGFALILRSPRIGHPQTLHSLQLDGVRAWHVRGFRKWLVYYREVEDGIEVLDVLHGAQDHERRLRQKLEDEGMCHESMAPWSGPVLASRRAPAWMAAGDSADGGIGLEIAGVA